MWKNKATTVVTLTLVCVMSACTQTTHTKEENKHLTQTRATNNQTALTTSDKIILELGYKTCSGLDVGLTGNEIVESIASTANYGEDPEFIGLVINSAQQNLCPKHREVIK